MDDEELIRSLQDQVAAQAAELAVIREQLRRTEYYYRCQCRLSLELSDELHAHGIQFRLEHPVFGEEL